MVSPYFFLKKVKVATFFSRKWWPF